MIDILKYSISNLWNRKMRSFLTVLSILIGITAIFALISFGQGINSWMNEFAQEMGTDKIFLLPGSGLATAPGTSNILFTEDDIDFIKKVKGVDEVTGMLLSYGKVEFKDFRERLPDFSSLDPKDLKFYISVLQDLGYRYSTLKEHNSAASIFKKIIKLDPENQRAHYNLAVCYYAFFNKRSSAYNELKKVIEINPKTRIAAKAEFYIDYMRRNPDSRIIGDFTFMEEE